MISIIIPTYNEGPVIRNTVDRVISLGGSLVYEVIVSDGTSNDNTIAEAMAAGAKVIVSKNKGRAAQMNEGANEAKGSILYFLHADSIPPNGFAKDIIEATGRGNVAGCYRLSFDYDHWFLKTQAWFTRFDVGAFRYGDQSLFVLRNVFTQCKGFNSSLVIFEDNEIINRIKRLGSFEILGKHIVTSARKYRSNGIFKTQLVFYFLYFLYIANVSQERLVKVFKACLKQDKI
ncbi:MAG: TIGR04283 family arsenosugar biosynthesis glycosyltransferase [Chryseolinea sp.]